ncbi:MAG: hypothetical protein KKD63_10240 [Proteobacteria bacterium]|nr:hypothetical protein [Desulfobulbaceae bacterium]MBU4153249.1 hypothetical protein [Pseudomonadota bacterium]
MKEFIIQDCTLLSRTSGVPPAINLRELRQRLANCKQDVLYHHFCETPLVPSFDNPDSRNDFAVWALLQLGDRVLAERLGIINPYIYTDLEELRELVLDILDERLSEVPFVPSCQNGGELFFTEAVTIVFDTGGRISSPEELPAAIEKMTNGSIYYHFMEARRRDPIGCDDFSAWLASFPDQEDWCRKLQKIDFAFFTLSELRNALVTILDRDKGGAS